MDRLMRHMPCSYREPPSTAAESIMSCMERGPRLSGPSESTHTCDIVFVHGLQHDFNSAWESEAASVSQRHKLWPYHLLPDDIGNMRVMLWGYRDPKNLSPPNLVSSLTQRRSNVQTHARQLLAELSRKREHQHTSRPIIWVGHDVGGLIIKEALIIAATGRDSLGTNVPANYTMTRLYNSTLGVLFLGTPHGRSNDCSLGELVAELGRQAWPSRPEQDLTHVDENAVRRLDRILVSQHHQWVDISQRFRIVCFYPWRSPPGFPANPVCPVPR
ncbi:hypothetical protein B0T19DRAFT_400924 [Cercophora scortea]|uniref:Uncharacterized protein n=1 Tax=Cercophora scortea TaxID=314031 RepID=A0AAE0IMZ0_9PEZI|nr:hypothetical protein B0T19DRAFT_400924 [Cercophora scortea]